MHALLIAGAALVGLPIILHLIMKQEPKRLSFPAFRFLRQQLKTNQRKLRLRHFLLLLLRMLLIALFCLALYQPSLRTGGLVIGQQPVAVVIVLDSSPSMGYLDNGRTRLEEAKRRALELLDELPDKSAVALVETGDPGGYWLPSLTEARKRINDVKEARGGGQPITSALGTAYQLLRTVEQETEATETLPRLVAVFTDRAAACWDATRTDDLKKLRDGTPDPKPLHAVIDVGVEQPANVAILSAEMKPQIVPANQAAVVTVTLGAAGPEATTTVAAKLDDARNPERKEVAIPGGQTRSVTFEFRDLKPGLHQIEFTLGTPDKLKFDDTRYFTFRTAEPRKILTIADNPDEALFWQIAHDEKGDFANATARPADVKAADLFQYEAVCLFAVANPGLPAGDSLWEKLRKYVEAGGKLVIVPGDRERMTPAGYDPSANEGPSRLMPAKLLDVVNTREGQPPEKPDDKTIARRTGSAWDVEDESALKHPMVAPFAEWKRRGNINFVKDPPRAWKYWDVEKWADGAVVVRYDNDDDPAKRKAAVMERVVGKGRVLLLTTRMDNPTDRDATWNDYWNLDSSWSVVFPNLVVKYLAGDTADANFNHRTGQTITVPLPRTGGKREDISLSGPNIGIDDGLIKTAEKQVELRLGPPRTLSAGNFKLVPVSPTPEWTAGFSLNAAAEESQLDKVPVAAIEELTGPDRVFPVGRDAKLSDILTGKVIDYPIDLFPWLLILVLLLLAVEGLVANRFYRRKR